MRIVCSALVLVAVLGGCASIPSTPSPSFPFIELEPDAAPGRWRATWHLSRPTRELRFERETSFRGGVFEVLTPGFSVQREGDVEVLRTGGEPQSKVTVTFPELTREFEKDYDFFLKFSGGSAAVYTGHLVARPVYDGDPADCDACYVRTFRFGGPAGTRLVVGGRVMSTPFLWLDETGQGSYIYFGSLAPVASPAMISIVDPALPVWLAEEITRSLPRLFELYAARLGAPLVKRPTVLINYRDSGGSGYSSGGGTLPGQIHLTLDGAAWKERSQPALKHLMHFLAHEAVHLWNGQVIHYGDTEDSWMHEGSADAMAQRTLLELGLTDEATFLEDQTSALNECRRKLEAFPLREAGKRQIFPLYYSCGNALALYTESTMTGGDLFTFWNRLIRRVLDSGRSTYGADDYYAVLRESGGSAEDLDRLRALVERRASASDLTAMLASSGVLIADEENPPHSYGHAAARDGLLHLLEEHCTGSYGFTNVETGLSLTKSNRCGAIPAGAVLTAIGGHDVRREGHRAWDTMQRKCGTPDPVSLALSLDGGEQVTVGVVCRTAVPPLPPYVKITRVVGQKR